MEQHDQQTIPAVPATTSLMNRIANVFMSPDELYSEVAAAPVQRTSWLVAYVLGLLVAVFTVITMFSTPSLLDQILTAQREAMQEQVAAGKMTAEQAEKAENFVSPTMMKVFGTIGAVVFVTAAMFLIPLVLFGIAKLVFQFTGSYQKMLEVYGLATFIGIFGGVVTVVMMVGMDSILAQPGPVFFIRDTYMKDNFLHGILGGLNIFTAWEAAVVGIGFGKVTGKSTAVGMAVTFGLWALWVVAAAAFGWGAR